LGISHPRTKSVIASDGSGQTVATDGEALPGAVVHVEHRTGAWRARR
jgi:hypothetical protein